MTVARGLDTSRKPIIFDCPDAVTGRCVWPGQAGGPGATAVG